MKKILLCAPVRQDEKIFKKYIDGLNNLEIPDNIIVQRLFTFHNCKELSKYLKTEDKYTIYETKDKYEKTNVTHLWREENLQAVATMKNLMIEYALKNEYDYIFFVDSDLILHRKTLVQLLNRDKDIIAEIFWTRWTPEKPSMPNAWDLDHYTFYRDTIEKYKKPGIYKCGGTGACILISKKVIQRNVNYDKIYNVSFWGEDRHFCIRATCAGFQIFIDTCYPAQHLYRD